MNAPAKELGRKSSGFELALGFNAFVAILGVALAFILIGSQLADRETAPSSNVFYYIFADQEPVACAIQLLTAALLIWVYKKGKSVSLPFARSELSRVERTAVAAFVFVVALAGTFLVFHNFGLSLDEYATSFQATTFAHGHLVARVPGEWSDLTPWLRTSFVIEDPKTHAWVAPYLPVYSAFRAVFHLLGAPWLLNPLLGAFAVVAATGIARRLWPQYPAIPWICMGLLVTSPQFLVTSMTAYSMPAHLALNLLWLWLFLRGDHIGMLLAPLVGILAVGLHQPNVHLLFAFPFCFRLVLQRRWGWSAYYLISYLAGIFVWWLWWSAVRPAALDDSGAMMTLPRMRQVLIQPLNFVLIFSWQSILTGVLAVLALSRWKALPVVVKDAFFGCVLTFLSYIAFDSNQGHGWGYRYFYAVLGNLVIVACAGWPVLTELVGDATARTVSVISFAVSLLVIFPFRAFEAERFVAPFARADAYLKTVHADTVFIPPFAVWYGYDLVRNEPFLTNTPKRAALVALNEARFKEFQKRGSVAIISREQLERFGLIPRITNEQRPNTHRSDSVPK